MGNPWIILRNRYHWWKWWKKTGWVFPSHMAITPMCQLKRQGSGTRVMDAQFWRQGGNRHNTGYRRKPSAPEDTLLWLSAAGGRAGSGPWVWSQRGEIKERNVKEGKAGLSPRVKDYRDPGFDFKLLKLFILSKRARILPAFEFKWDLFFLAAFVIYFTPVVVESKHALNCMFLDRIKITLRKREN